MKNLVELFCDVDDFCKLFIPQWKKQLLENGTLKRQRNCRLSMSKIITITICFHMSPHRDFKNYHLDYVLPMQRENRKYLGR